MSDIVIRGKPTGTDAVAAEFSRLKDSVQRKYIRRAVTQAARKATAAAKSFVPVESGALKRSIGFNVGYEKTSGIFVGRIRPRKGFGQRVTKVRGKRRRIGKRGAAAGAKIEKREPTFYAHLVERGTVRMPARPFMRPSESVADTALQTHLVEQMDKAIREATGG